MKKALEIPVKEKIWNNNHGMSIMSLNLIQHIISRAKARTSSCIKRQHIKYIVNYKTYTMC